jgi:hypothetical protein
VDGCGGGGGCENGGEEGDRCGLFAEFHFGFLAMEMVQVVVIKINEVGYANMEQISQLDSIMDLCSI